MTLRLFRVPEGALPLWFGSQGPPLDPPPPPKEPGGEGERGQPEDEKEKKDKDKN